MLTLSLPNNELWDSEHNKFIDLPNTLHLEHSLVSISKWESENHKPFLSSEHSPEEIIDYIKCMSLDDAPDYVFYHLPKEALASINSYIEDPYTATTVSTIDKKTPGHKEIVTAEVVYYWMFSFNIPLECETWHFNKLMMLINVFNAKNAPEKKMSKRDLRDRNRALNAQRRAKYKTKG